MAAQYDKCKEHFLAFLKRTDLDDTKNYALENQSETLHWKRDYTNTIQCTKGRKEVPTMTEWHIFDRIS